MTKLLEQVFSRVKKLPASERDTVAMIVIEELASEQAWTGSLARSQAVLAKLAGRAMAEHAAGRTRPITKGGHEP